MRSLASYPVPHLFGRVDYSVKHAFSPDGDTVHLRNPALLIDGRLIAPKDGRFFIWTTGATAPKVIRLKGKPGSYYVPIRFEGIDAPEEHYRASPFSVTVNGKKLSFPIDRTRPFEERSAPLWSPAARYAVDTLQQAGWAVVTLDREVVDRYGRVLGYVYASNSSAERGTFISLELLKRGLAFPFLFESSGARIPTFLAAASDARKKNLGVWKRYHARPLTFTSDTYPAPKKYTDPEPIEQQKRPLNLAMVFRRVVDAYQLKGLSLKFALQKYDAMDFETGTVLPGDQYHKISLDRLIWAPHRFE